MVKSGNPKAKGWLSSIIAIIAALLLLHTFPLMGNWIDNQRAGEGKYDFDEEMCFDITEETDFNNAWKLSGSDDEGAMAYFYKVPTGKNNNNKVIMLDVPINGTVNEYGVSTTKPNAGDVPVAVSGEPNYLLFQFNFTKKKIIDLDTTRIDIYLAIAGVAFSEIVFVLTDESGSKSIFDTKISVGNLTSIKVEVTDLLAINTLKDEKIQLRFTTEDGEFIPANTFVVFDMQFYCIEEIKVPTLTRLAGWLSLMNVCVLILIFIGLPQIQILGRFNEIGKRLEKI